MITHDKFIYLRLQKTGSNFVAKFLKKFYQIKEHRESVHGAKTGHLGLTKKPDNKFVFCGIRNPWDWYVSFWSMVLNDPHRGPQFLVNGREFSQFLDFILNKKTGKSLQMFNFDRMRELNIGLYGHEYYRICCVNSQHLYKLEVGEESIDGVYRMENMIPSFIELFEKNVEKLNDKQKSFLTNSKKVNRFPHKHYSEYYNDELKEMVLSKEKYIINKYNYKFE